MITFTRQSNSVATRLRCGGMLNNSLIATCPQSVLVKEFFGVYTFIHSSFIHFFIANKCQSAFAVQRFNWRWRMGIDLKVVCLFCYVFTLLFLPVCTAFIIIVIVV